MGWLIGLPLGIFRMLLGILMVLVRLAVPILVIAVVIFLWRRSRRGGDTSQSKEPDFDGPCTPWTTRKWTMTGRTAMELVNLLLIALLALLLRKLGVVPFVALALLS